MSEQQVITLKWGTLKGWEVAEGNTAAMDLLKRYHELGVSFSVGAQKDSAEQTQLLVDLISLPDMQVYLDWDNKFVSQSEGIQYLQDYGKPSVHQPVVVR